MYSSLGVMHLLMSTVTIAARRGYQSTKAAMELLMGPRRLYIDEIGLASRDAIEALRLGKLIEKPRQSAGWGDRRV